MTSFWMHALRRRKTTIKSSNKRSKKKRNNQPRKHRTKNTSKMLRRVLCRFPFTHLFEPVSLYSPTNASSQELTLFFTYLYFVPLRTLVRQFPISAPMVPCQNKLSAKVRSNTSNNSQCDVWILRVGWFFPPEIRCVGCQITMLGTSDAQASTPVRTCNQKINERSFSS